jgi:predicted ATPase
VDLNTALPLLAKASSDAMPCPDEDVGETLWSLPEVLRVNAELLLWHNTPDAAEATLQRALDLARQQSALSWELRATTSLARLWHRTGRRTEGRALLAAIYDRFTEGFETADLAGARRLLGQWS